MSAKPESRLSRVWNDLRRRRVVSTTIAYVIGASILVEGAVLVVEVLVLPPWIPRAVLILAILALPLVIFLSYTINLKIKLERDSSTAEPDAEPVDPSIQYDSLPEPLSPPNPATAIASVAVLPFEYRYQDDSREPDTEKRSETDRFVADGIALELHSTLSKMHRLRVASRTLSFLYAEHEDDTQKLAHKLNVHFIISGSVQCEGDRMRVFVELDNAIEGVQVWSETYDRELRDVFSVQHDIAQQVVGAFGHARLREEISTATIHPTPSLDAWSLVQKARSYVLAFTPDALANAVPPLRKAIELDGGYAAAHAALASVLAEQILNGLSESPEDDRETAMISANHAFSLSPIDPFVLKMCGAVWGYFGRIDMSISALRRAVDLAPFDFGSWGYMGWPLVETGAQRDLDELHEIVERIIRAAPQHPGVPYWLYHRSVACTCEDRTEEACELAQKSVDRNPIFPWGWMNLANTQGRLGRSSDAHRSIRRCNEISPELTPQYYEGMIRSMSASDEFANKRIDGLGAIDILE